MLRLEERLVISGQEKQGGREGKMVRIKTINQNLRDKKTPLEREIDKLRIIGLEDVILSISGVNQRNNSLTLNNIDTFYHASEVLQNSPQIKFSLFNKCLYVVDTTHYLFDRLSKLENWHIYLLSDKTKE